jgi:hypothetical protein
VPSGPARCGRGHRPASRTGTTSRSARCRLIDPGRPAVVRTCRRRSPELRKCRNRTVHVADGGFIDRNELNGSRSRAAASIGSPEVPALGRSKRRCGLPSNCRRPALERPARFDAQPSQRRDGDSFPVLPIRTDPGPEAPTEGTVVDSRGTATDGRSHTVWRHILHHENCTRAEFERIGRDARFGRRPRPARRGGPVLVARRREALKCFLDASYRLRPDRSSRSPRSADPRNSSRSGCDPARTGRRHARRATSAPDAQSLVNPEVRQRQPEDCGNTACPFERLQQNSRPAWAPGTCSDHNATRRST